jgi:hypothetical protein
MTATTATRDHRQNFTASMPGPWASFGICIFLLFQDLQKMIKINGIGKFLIFGVMAARRSGPMAGTGIDFFSFQGNRPFLWTEKTFFLLT